MNENGTLMLMHGTDDNVTWLC